MLIPGFNPTTLEFSTTYNASAVVGYRFFQSRGFFSKTHFATRDVVNFYSDGVVSRDRSIGSW
jgi:hypothetical protein